MLTNNLLKTGAGGIPPTTSEFIIIGTAVNPYLLAYEWDSATGFGNKIFPDTQPVGTVANISVSPDKTAIATASSTSPYINAWQWSSLGFGAKFANPSVLPTGGRRVEFSSSGNAVAIVGSTATLPNVAAYSWSSTTGFGTKYANPSVYPAGTTGGISFNSGIYVAISHSNSPYVSLYYWDDTTGFGVKLADPTTNPGSAGYGISFAPYSGSESVDVLAISTSIAPAIHAYAVSDELGFAYKYSNPASIPQATTTGSVSFSNDRSLLARSGSNLANPVNCYNWSSSGFGSKLENPPSPTSASNYYAASFSTNSDAIAYGMNAAPYIDVYPVSVSGFGVKYGNASPGLHAGAISSKFVSM